MRREGSLPSSFLYTVALLKCPRRVLRRAENSFGTSRKSDFASQFTTREISTSNSNWTRRGSITVNTRGITTTKLHVRMSNEKEKFRQNDTEISIYINCRCTTKGIFFFFYNANPLSKIGDSNLTIRPPPLPSPSIFAATCSFAKGKERSLKFIIIRNKWCDNDGNILRYSRIRFIRFL